jgi:hypothetical protein
MKDGTVATRLKCVYLHGVHHGVVVVAGARAATTIDHSESGKRVYTDPTVMMYIALSLSQKPKITL